MNELAGKVAVVTGASKGIGAQIAITFGAAGAAVVVNYASSKEGADRVASEIERRGGKALAVRADVSRAEDLKRLFAETRDAFGRLDVLVNNAGVWEFEPLEAVTQAELHREFGTNVLGPILAIQEATKLFGDRGGTVINIGTVAVRHAMPNSVVYSASKSALDAVTRVLAAELGPRRIRVNTLHPGGVDTEGTRRTGVAGGEMEKAVVARTPLGRFGRPDDIARVALFLASDDAAWVTGESLAASGGFA